jgi:hypothetical protein
MPYRLARLPHITGRFCGVAAIVLAIVLTFAGCAYKIVSDYDPATFEEILSVSRKVDRFYGYLLEAPEPRPYEKYAQQYVDIEADLRSLYIRNQVRLLNQESARISQITLDQWIAARQRHRRENNYRTPIAELERERFTRVFLSGATAERTKSLAAEEAPAKGGK